jgi:hypothetical protein
LKIDRNTDVYLGATADIGRVKKLEIGFLYFVSLTVRAKKEAHRDAPLHP